jgi:TPR repeat protein
MYSIMADKNKAVGYYNKAAGLGDVEAMNCLGIMYENGLGLDN